MKLLQEDSKMLSLINNVPQESITLAFKGWQQIGIKVNGFFHKNANSDNFLLPDKLLRH